MRGDRGAEVARRTAGAGVLRRTTTTIFTGRGAGGVTAGSSGAPAAVRDAIAPTKPIVAATLTPTAKILEASAG